MDYYIYIRQLGMDILSCQKSGNSLEPDGAYLDGLQLGLPVAFRHRPTDVVVVRGIGLGAALYPREGLPMATEPLRPYAVDSKTADLPPRRTAGHQLQASKRSAVYIRTVLTKWKYCP